MLMITGQKPIKKSKQGRFQILDVVDDDGADHQVHPPARLAPTTSRAGCARPSACAEEEKPGAVHLELPEDIADEQTDSHAARRAASRAARSADDEGGARGGRARSSRRAAPILVIGAGANRKMTSRMLLQFVEKTGIPFFTTQMGKGVIDETPSAVPRLRGAVGGRLRATARSRPPTCIINVGHDVIEKPPFFMQRGRRRGDPRLAPAPPRSTRSISRRSR